MKILQGEIGYEINLTDFQGDNEIMINSPGGSLFEGLAMFDFVKSSNIEVGVIGLCASAATLPLLASKNRWGTPNSRYLIHNPSFFTFGNATASDLKRDAESLQKEQDRALQLYFENLNGTKEELQALMDRNEVIDANEALKLGIILEIREFQHEETENENLDSEMLSNMYHKFKMKINNRKMTKDEEISKELTGIRGMLSKALKFFSNPKMIVIQDVNGNELDFGAEIETKEQIQVGATATVGGAPASGEYTLQDGTIYVFEAGKLNEIRPPAPSEEENKALKEENATLKAENELIKNQLNLSVDELNKVRLEYANQLKEINQKFITIQNKYGAVGQIIDTPPGEPEKKKPGYSYKFKN